MVRRVSAVIRQVISHLKVCHFPKSKQYCSEPTKEIHSLKAGVGWDQSQRKAPSHHQVILPSGRLAEDLPCHRTANLHINDNRGFSAQTASDPCVCLHPSSQASVLNKALLQRGSGESVSNVLFTINKFSKYIPYPVMTFISNGQQDLHAQKGDWQKTRVISETSFPPRTWGHLLYHANLTNSS